MSSTYSKILDVIRLQIKLWLSGERILYFFLASLVGFLCLKYFNNIFTKLFFGLCCIYLVMLYRADMKLRDNYFFKILGITEYVLHISKTILLCFFSLIFYASTAMVENPMKLGLEHLRDLAAILLFFYTFSLLYSIKKDVWKFCINGVIVSGIALLLTYDYNLIYLILVTIITLIFYKITQHEVNSIV